MAIELFAIDARGAQPRLRWIDCAMRPEKTLPNAVTTLPGDGCLVISFYGGPAGLRSGGQMTRAAATASDA